MTSLLAGALGMSRVRFVIAGSIGRLLRFGVLAMLGNAVCSFF
jgi:membrane protein YqaA with SNARE-associated domain